ncbi:hypothetical protein IC582_013764 [Cucumis melo]
MMLQELRGTREKIVVEYNENGIPIGENGHKLQSFIGSCVHHHIPITHTSWKVVPTELKEKICSMVEGAFVVDGRSKKTIMKTTKVSFCQFKSWLTTQYIIAFMDEPQLLIDPPSLYAHIIDKLVWQEFVRLRMSSEFQDEILDKAPNEESPNDALTQALCTLEYGGRVCGTDGFITPTVYFHQAKRKKSNKVDTTQQIIDENEALRKHIRELEQKVQSIPTSKHGSCSKSKVQEKEEVKEEEVIATRPMTKNEVNVKVKASRPMTKEVEITSEPLNLPIQLKYILRYAKRVMVDGSSFQFQLPLELFGIPRKSYVLREDVIDFCNMPKVKTLSMVAYITYLYSLIIDLKKVSKYAFVDPSLISAGHSTQEIRARNLCSRLMTSKQDQLVVAPYNPGALTIFQSQKNLKKTRKTTFWKAVKELLNVDIMSCDTCAKSLIQEIHTHSLNWMKYEWSGLNFYPDTYDRYT